MNIIVLHGDNSKAIHERLFVFITEAKKRGWGIKRLDINLKESLPEIVSNPTLFLEDQLFIFENLKKLTKKDTIWIKEKSSNIAGTMVFVNEKTIGKNELNFFPKGTKFEEFNLPVFLFKFIESIRPKNKEVLKLFHAVIESEPPELVFSLIAKQFRDLYWVKTDPSTIPYPSWKVQKLENQAHYFT